MADDINNPLGDAAGSRARKKQLDDIRQSAIDAKAEIRQLGQEFAALQKNAKDLGVKQFISSAEVGKVSQLQEVMSKMTVSTLKNASARKSFVNDIVKAEQENAKLTSTRGAIQKEIDANNALAQDRAIEASKIMRDAEIEYQEAVASGNKEKIAQAERDKATAKAISLMYEEEESEFRQRASNLTGQNKLIDERIVKQNQSINAAKELEKEVEKINKAGGSILESFAKLGNTLLQNVPLIGTAFNKIFSELISARKLFQDAVAQGTSKMEARFKATQGAITSLTLVGLGGFISGLYKAMLLTSEFSVEVKKGLGGGFIDASRSMAAASEAAGRLTIPITEAAAMVGQLNGALGTSLGFTGDILTTFGTLTKKIGVSADTAAHLFKISAKIGQPFEELTQNIIGSTEKLNALNNAAIAPKAIFEEIGHASETILRANAKNPDALIKAAHGARMMGMEMSKIEDAARSTLDFESSMANEMEAELMLGKELNLDRLRAAAATGDVATQQEEIARLVAENKDRLEGNVLAQEMFAKTVGMSGEELNKMLNSQDEMSKMTKNDAARKAANAKNEKLSAEEIGKRQMNAMEGMATLANKIDKMIESFKLGIKDFADNVVIAFAPLKNFNLSKITDTFKGEGLVAAIKETFSQIYPIVTETLGNLGELIMGTFTDAFKNSEGSLLSKGGILGKLLGAGVLAGGGLSIAFKGLSGLGSVFNKLRGTRMLPMFVKMSGGFLKSLSRLVGGKSTMVGRGFRNLSAAFKKSLRSANIGKALRTNLSKAFSNLKMPNLTKIFSKIKLPNLTSIFSKIKLPNLTSIFSKIKLPNLTNIFSKIKIPTGAAGGLLKTIGGKILAPLELAMGAFKGVNQVKDLTAEQKKEQGIKESMGTTEAGIIGALTGNANKGSIFSEKLGIEKGGAGDEALGIATSGARGAMTGAAIGSVIPVVGTAVGAVVGGAIGVVSEGFKVFSDPNSKLRQGLSEFATATYDKASEIGKKIKETAKMVGEKISDFATNVKDRALEFGTAVKEKVANFASAASEKISAFASSVGEGISNFANSAKLKIDAFTTSVGNGIMSFANTARDKAKAFAGAVGEKIGNIKSKISDFIEANDGLVGGIRAAAAGLASKASEWFGSKVQGLKDWWNGSTATTPEIKEAEIKKVTTPLVQMSNSQSKELMTALNTALIKSAESTVQAVNSFGDNIEPYITETRITAEDQLQKMKELKIQGDKQHQKELMELRNQTALLYQYITNPQKSIIKMDSYKVGESIVSRY